MDYVKSASIYVRLTESEKRRIERRAAEAGLTVSEFVRSSSLRANVNVIDIEPMHKALYELVKEGANLNQLTRHAHINEGAIDREEVDKVMSGLRTAHSQLTESLISLRKQLEKRRVCLRTETAGGSIRDGDTSKPKAFPSLAAEVRDARAAARALSGSGA